MLGRSFVARQVASSTNAVATGITEKLNQKRINAAMSEPEEDQLGALQLVAQIGEGGFAKVFRGLYRCAPRVVPQSCCPEPVCVCYMELCDKS
jgi:hypothetical protein